MKNAHNIYFYFLNNYASKTILCLTPIGRNSASKKQILYNTNINCDHLTTEKLPPQIFYFHMNYILLL